jgi:hypothetical protein
MSYKLPLALIALAIIMLVGCKQPVGVPSDVHAATDQTVYCRPVDIMDPTGHIDWYQTVYGLSGGFYNWDTDTITRGYTDSAGHNWPRRIGICVFKIPHFESPFETPKCTLFYYQESHTSYGDTLFVNSWYNANIHWPPWPGDWSTVFGAAWGSNDLVAEDITHSTDGWKSVELSDEVCAAIADSGAASEVDEWVVFFTAWIYSGSVDSTYTNVAGDYDLDYAPYIKVDYDDGN